METEVSVCDLSREIPKDAKDIALKSSDDSFEEKDKDADVHSSVKESSSVTGDTGPFKRPIFSVSKRSRSKAGDSNVPTDTHGHAPIIDQTVDTPLTNSTQSESEQPRNSRDSGFSYVEPSWGGGKPQAEYKMEVLKSGVIKETISLNESSYYVIGRLPSCDMSLAHPTISRYHAVLQYRSSEDESNSKGFYVYDLGSTHGTFWNGHRIKPNTYVRVHGGHMLRFGCSQRKYILQAPLDDREEESEYTVSQLKEKRALELEKRRAEMEEEEAEMLKQQKESEAADTGIDWGMGEDADEATDLEENPFASITDEDLVLDDPKKTLRGWFEREGYDLRYQTEEKGIGQFLCWVTLPIENVAGNTVKAEALVKGKKKEAVIQCALEACKILDKYGLLRQANHEARKRKTRNWEEADYYDSDEDNFLDRTGSVEKKREQRMRLAGKLEEKVETYDSLLKKHAEVENRIAYLADAIKKWQQANECMEKKDVNEEDELDAFMSSLNSSALTKSDVAKMKIELQNLRKEEAGLLKLLHLTRPANMPALTPHSKVGVSQTKVKMKARTVRNVRLEEEKKQPLPSSYVEVESDEDSDSKPDDSISTSGVDDSDSNRVATPGQKSSEPQQRLPAAEGGKQEKRGAKAAKKPRGCAREMQSCDQDVYKDNYSTWVPPQNQAGDGRTDLNEKYGY